MPAARFHPLPIDERPHDITGTAKGLTFKTLEHDEHTLQHAIEETDAEGRGCIYVVMEEAGKIGRWETD